MIERFCVYLFGSHAGEFVALAFTVLSVAGMTFLFLGICFLVIRPLVK